MRYLLCALLISTGIHLPALAGDEPLTCPLSGKPAAADKVIRSEGEKIGFCCDDCLATFIEKRENRLSDAQRAGKWQLLFDGKSLEGFQKPTRDGKWEVRRGVLTGHGGKGVLATVKKFRDFELTVDVKIQDTGERRGNSGVFIRSTALDALNGRWPDGLEVQVDNGDPNFWTGAIWKTAAAKKVATKDGEWLTLRIQAAGPLVRIWVNDELATTYQQPVPAIAGPISLQVHHPTDLVEFKNLKIRALQEV